MSAELARLFNILSHPVRVRIVEELQKQALTVGSLKERLGISHSAVSQQLSLMRSNHLVVENRQGRHVYYHLRQPELAKWIMEGMRFISPDATEIARMVVAIENAKTAWATATVKEELGADEPD